MNDSSITDFSLSADLGELLEWAQHSIGEFSLELRPLDTAQQPVALRCSEVLRMLPGRRVVCKAHLGEQPLVVKLFLGQGAQRYQQRELAGCDILLKAGIPTPQIVARLSPEEGTNGVEGNPLVCGIVFGFLTDSQPLDDEQLNTQPELFDELWGLLAQMNEAGVTHRDLHFGNLMRRGDRLWLIDGDAVSQKSPSALGPSDSALAFVKLAAQAQSSLPVESLLSHWASYCGRRRFPSNAFPQALLVRNYRRVRRARVLHFQAKTQRNCSAFSSRRTVLGQALLDRSFLQECALASHSESTNTQSETHSEAHNEAQSEAQIGRELLGWLDALPGSMDEEIAPLSLKLKTGNTATVVTASFRGHSLVVKRYNNKSLAHRIRRFLRPDRGLNSWIYAHTLAFTGIRTAQPVALLKTRFAGPSYLVMKAAPGVELSVAQFQDSAMEQRFEPVGQKLMLLFNQLAAEGLVHGDTKASNFLWDAKSEELSVIDLDSMRMPSSRRALNNGHARDRRRLLRNFATTPDLQRRLESLFASVR